MRVRRPTPLAALAAAIVIVAAACGSSKSSSTPTTTAPAATTAAPSTTAAPALSGSLTVFAASSLTEAYDTAQTALKTTDPGLSLTYDFAGSQALVQQIEQGAPADVFASADETNMNKLVAKGLVETPQVFAHNLLEIAVAPGNPQHITSLADLTKPGLKVVLEDPSVPAGKYARQALTKLGLTVHSVSNPLDVKSALLTVTSGEADATVVYVTDVSAANGKAQGVPIPSAQNVLATYPIAVIKASSHQAAAQAYVAYMVSGAGQQILRARGFLAP
jgi:molybdate transport system substrate-binding protein